MASRRAWWQRRRVKHRDIWAKHLTPYLVNPPEFVLRATLALFAFTTAFGAVLVLTGGWFFLRGNIPRGRFLVGLGVGVGAHMAMGRYALVLKKRVGAVWRRWRRPRRTARRLS